MSYAIKLVSTLSPLSVHIFKDIGSGIFLENLTGYLLQT